MSLAPWVAEIIFAISVLARILSANIVYAEDFRQEAVNECIRKCPFQNRTDDERFNLGCDLDCNKDQCTIGCQLWKRALESSCQTVCNVTSEVLPPKELYCVMGCNEALNLYFQRLKDLIGTPPAPALVADSLTSSSLSLEWEGTRYSNLSYLVQWRYEEVAGAWQYCRNQTWGEHSTIRVENLQPYTKYRFRVAVLLSARHGDPIVSEPSVVISTLPLGPPTSPPIAVRITAVDPHRISLSWEPGPFPNGPVMSYVLRISDTTPNGYLAVKDIPSSENTLFYMFQNLSPERTYTVAITMRNVDGEGPKATVQATTPPLPTAVANQQPILILGGQHAVVQQAADMLAEPTVLYRTHFTIEGVAIDVSKGFLFISDSSGSVYKTLLSQQSNPTPIITPSTVSYKPSMLSVDWLNEHLYVLGEVTYGDENTRWDDENSAFVRWQVIRCDFNGKGQTVAFAAFHSKPVHIEVDPYNGYLFWAIQGHLNGGLYRLDLADISNGVKHDDSPDLMLRDSFLGAFTVDHTNFRILIPQLKKNTVFSVSLDGREMTNFRNNTQKPMFHIVQSLALANGLFYWTNGAEVLTEEYHKGQNSYFHNAYPDLIGERFSTVLVALRSSQPIPVAVNPPVGLQSVMGTNCAKITWQPPHLLGHQGNGAWRQWQYHLQLTDVQENTTMHKFGINETSFMIRDLAPNMRYTLKVAAVTSSGTGPWSSEFTGRTLPISSTGLYSSILWSVSQGLLTTDLTGDNVKILIHRDYLRDSYIKDVSWFKDQLFMVTNSSTVLWYNMTSHERGWIENMDNVGSLAVDWIGKKLYWSNPKQQLITRGSLTGTNREPVPIVTVGKELKIDAEQGYLYWNTGHAIECARLNGEDKFTYYPAEFFSGKQVMGLTVDFKGKSLYWVVRGYEGSNLYKAPTADILTDGQEVSGSLVSSMSSVSMLGPLCFFSGRLLWLQDDTNAIITDLQGRNIANLNGVNMESVNTIAILDPNLQSEGLALNAIPEAVDSNTIRVNGVWNSFNIFWMPTNVSHGQVFYDINVDFNGRFQMHRTTTQAWVSYNEARLAPYTLVDITIRAYSYWGGSQLMRIITTTPESPPTHPTNTRIFIQHSNGLFTNDNQISAVYRWDEPMHVNGIIKGYRIVCWYTEDGIENTVCDGDNVPSEPLQYTVKNLLKNVTYFFQVQAFTNAGYGPLSHISKAFTDIESPIPRLVISSHDAIKVADLDLGDSFTYTIAKSSGKAVDFAVSISEGLIYWMDELQEIFISRIDETGHSKLISINGSAVSITIDWVSRMLYWSQMELATDLFGCAIYKIDLNVVHRHGNAAIERVLRSNKHIYNLQVSPSTRSLYWVETNHLGIGRLMTSKTDGSNMRPFFGRNSHSKDRFPMCNCPENLSVMKSFVLDLTKEDDHKIFWVDAWTYHIAASDMDGCRCRVVVNATDNRNYGLPPNYLTLDAKSLYWSNTTQKQIFTCAKSATSRLDIRKVNITAGHKIQSISPRLQQYPSKNCLVTKQASLNVSLLESSPNSLTLLLPDAVVLPVCKKLGYEMATTYYTILYQPYVEGDTTECTENACTAVKSFKKQVLINGLRPLTKYSFYLQVNNYYGELKEIKSVTGPVVVLKTLAGAPGPVRNIKTSVLNPTMIRMEWLPPILISGSSEEQLIWYEVHWRTEGTSRNLIKEHNTFSAKTNSSSNKVSVFTDIKRLLPSQMYTVWVRTYSQNTDLYTDSEEVQIRTFPEPNNITLTSSEPYALHVSWMPYENVHTLWHNVEIAELVSEKWTKVEDNGSKKSDGSINYVVSDLQPKTQYKLRLVILYVNNTTPFIWPSDSRFTFVTSGDKPSPPGKPAVQRLSGAVYQLQWNVASPHGSPIILYRLWGQRHSQNAESREGGVTEDAIRLRTQRETYMDVMNVSVSQQRVPYYGVNEMNEVHDLLYKEGWKLLYNGTENYWIIAELKLSEKYTFYVQALNSYGWSDLSEPSEEFDFTDAAMMAIHQDHWSLILSVGIPILAILFSLVIGAFIYSMGATGGRGADVELATLRCLPRGRHAANALYGQPPAPLFAPLAPDADLAVLPHIPREKIFLTKFLGSGAFGEVFEGTAKGLRVDGQDTKVAVKTLRKGATDQEKTEFLQEAQLMSNFKHEHILRMLGICLDNDPHFIIMELMEGGDLLSYLRTKRQHLYTPNSLTLLDLITMCVDVTKGCRYLEEMHFVHRDLACRNCLVSQNDNGRIVKIGDFGLARDIYKNDYYRKEGEGLLPVRWMASECLVDGVFSARSDVWAWGVLCGEVLSLGQQPYPARTNAQVLAHVRRGGAPDRPPNCPDSFYKLLQMCWSYNPDHRPMFKYCLEVLEELKSKTGPDIQLPTSSADGTADYLTVLPDANGVSNRAYFMDENQNNRTTDGDILPKLVVRGEAARWLPFLVPRLKALASDRQVAELDGGLFCPKSSALTSQETECYISLKLPEVTGSPFVAVNSSYSKLLDDVAPKPVSSEMDAAEGPSKYPEFLYDSDTPTVCSDGYEIPRSSLRSVSSKMAAGAASSALPEDSVAAKVCSESDSEVNSLQRLIAVAESASDSAKQTDDRKLQNSEMKKLINGGVVFQNGSEMIKC